MKFQRAICITSHGKSGGFARWIPSINRYQFNFDARPDHGTYFSRDCIILL